jgi:hypothetical protein
VEAVTDTALLLGGPRDGQVVDLDAPAMRLDFPRYLDDGTLVMDAYAHAAARLHGERLAYRYEGERIPPAPDPALLARTRRERIRDFRDGLRGVAGRPAERIMTDAWEKDRAEEWAAARTWKFTGYYKYTFSFEAGDDGIHGLVNAGGDSGDIYRYDVEPEMTWLALGCGETDLWITDAAGHTLYACPTGRARWW